MSQRSTLTGQGSLMTLPTESWPSPFTGDERRSNDAIDALSRALDAVCVNAVDSLEIAAALESAGVTDQVARERYDHDDVFALADTLHQRVPLRSSAAGSARSQLMPSVGRIGRGALFALPGVFFLAVQDTFSSRLATAILVAVTIVGWAVSQAISVLAYRILSRSGSAAVNGFLRVCLLVALLGSAVVGVAGIALADWDAGLTVFALAQVVYIVAATALVHLVADALLALALAPGVFVAGLAVLAGSSTLSADVVATMTASVALTVIAAFVRTRRATMSGARPTREELRVAVPYVVYGALAGGLVAIPITAALAGGGRVSPWLALALLPLTLSMGLAEFELWRHHQRTGAALLTTADLATFSRSATASLGRTLARYAFVLGVLSVSGAVLGRVVGGSMPAGTTTLMVGYLALGVAFLAGLVLITAGRVTPVSAAIGAAIAAFFTTQSVLSPPIDVGFTAICAALMVVLLGTAFRDARRLVHHRYR